MSPAGGLKLHLEAPRRDRRVRFAPVSVFAGGSSEELSLVTDADGRLRYRLAPGDYRLRVEDLPESNFSVGPRGWTAVHLRLD